VPGYQACNETRPGKSRKAAAPVKNQGNFTAEYGESTKHAEQFWVRVQILTKFHIFHDPIFQSIAWKPLHRIQFAGSSWVFAAGRKKKRAWIAPGALPVLR